MLDFIPTAFSNLSEAGLYDWTLTFCGTLCLILLLMESYSPNPLKFIHNLFYENLSFLIVSSILASEVFITIEDRFYLFFNLHPLILLLIFFTLFIAYFYESLHNLLTSIIIAPKPNTTLLSRIREEVLSKAHKQGRLKVKQIVNIITQRNYTRAAPPSPHHQHLFSENELYCFTGIKTTDTEYPELIGYMRTKFSSFPYVPKGPSYREAIRRMRHFSTTGQDFSPFETLDESYRKIPMFIVFHFLTLSLLYILCAGRYPSGISAMLMVWGFTISEIFRRIFISAFTYISVAPSYVKRKIVSTIQSSASTWLTADNLLYSSAKGLASNPMSVMIQLKHISKSNNLQEFVESFWVLGALAGIERSIIHSIISRVLPSTVMTNPNLPPLVTEQGPGDNKSIAFMLAIAAGLLGISTNTIDARLVGTIGGIAASAFAIEKCWDTIEDTLCDWGLISTTKYEHVGEMFERMKNLITDVTEMGGHLNVNAAWFLVPANKARWDAARNDVLSLRTDCAATKYTALTGTTFQSELRMLTTRVEALHVQVEGFVGSCGIRICPTGIMFEGPSQIGKSHLTASFIRKVKSRLNEIFSPAGLALYPENLDIAPHFHQPQYWATWDQQFRDEYDTGYNGQKIHSIDDMFTQKKGIDQVPLLQFISPKRCGTVQASLEEKGKPYITQLVIVSCNQPPSSSPVITNLDALFNRFPIWVKCDLKAGRQPPQTGHDDSYDWLQLDAQSGHDRYVHAGIQQEWRNVSLEKLVNATVEDMIDRARQYDQELILERASWQGTPENPLNPILPTPIQASMMTRISSQVTDWFKHQLGYTAPITPYVPPPPTTPVTPTPMPRFGKPTAILKPVAATRKGRNHRGTPRRPAPVTNDKLANFQQFLGQLSDEDFGSIDDTVLETREWRGRHPQSFEVTEQGPPRVTPARLNADTTGLSFVEKPQVIATHENGATLLGTNWINHLDHCPMCQSFMASARSNSFTRNLSVMMSALNIPLSKMDLPQEYIQHLMDHSPWQFKSLNGSKIIAHLDSQCNWTVKPWTDPEALASAIAVERTRFVHTQPATLTHAPGFALKVYMMIGGWLGWDEHDTIQNYRDFVTRWNAWLSDNKLLMVIFVVIFCLSIIVGLVLNMRDTPEVLAEQEKRAKLIADLLRNPASATTEAKTEFQSTYNLDLDEALDVEEHAVNTGQTITRPEKIILLMGYGISSVGKGWFGSRLVEGLTNSGKTVRVVKIDPYYNKHAGNFHPTEHGECFVTEEGRECDLDVGRYYRAGGTLTKYGAFTGGLAHQWMENTENTEISLCDSLKTSIITEKLREEIEGFDYTVIEVGGTVSDTEATCFYDALGRIIKNHETTTLLLLPEVMTYHGQPKTRVIREGIKTARSVLGHPISAAIVRTVRRDFQLQNIEDTLIFQQPDADGAYPDTFGTILEVADELDLPITPPEPYNTELKPVKIGIVTKYPQMESHTSLCDQLDKVFCDRGMLPTVVPIRTPSELLRERPDYAVVAGGFGRTHIKGLTEVVRALYESDVPTLAICLGHQLTYRVVANYKMEELGERDAEIFMGNKEMRGKHHGHIYRNSFYVRPTSGMFSMFSSEETILKNPAGQKFAAARNWKPTYRSVQYHPEFEQKPNEDLLWLAGHAIQEQGGGYQGGQRRSTAVVLAEEQTVHNAQMLEASAFRAFMEKPLEHTPFNRHTAMGRVLVATEETAKKMGLDLKYKTILRKSRKLTYLVHPEDIEFTIPEEITNLRVPIIICLASRIKAAEGAMYRVWQQLPKNYVRRASPAANTEIVDEQMLPPRSVVLSVTDESTPNQAYSIDELADRVLETPIDQIIVTPRPENADLFNQVNMSGMRSKVQQRFPTQYFKYVESSDIIPIDPRMSFNHSQLFPAQKDAYEELGEKVTKALCAKYKHLALGSGLEPKDLRQRKVWDNIPLEKRSFDIYTKDGKRKKAIIGSKEQIERDLEAIKCPSLVKPALAALEVEEQKIRLRYDETVRETVEKFTSETDLGPLPAEETTPTDIVNVQGLEEVEEQGTDPQAIVLFHAMINKVLVGVTPFTMSNPSNVASGLGGWGYKNKILCPAHLSPNGIVGELFRISKYTYQVPGSKFFNPKEWTLAKLVKVDRMNDMMTLQILTTYELKAAFAAGGVQYPTGCSPFSDFSTLIERHIPFEDDITDRHVATAGAVFTPLSGFLTPGQFAFRKAEPLRMSYGLVKQYDVVKVTGLSAAPGTITQAGDCGGFYLVLNTNWQRKLVGMHTLASKDATYAQIMTVERLRKWTGEDEVEQHGPEQDLWDQIEEATVSDGAWQWETIDRRPELCDVEPIGPHKQMIGVTKFDVGSVPHSTDRLKKSPFYGMFPSTMEPACLSPNDPRITPENRAKLLKTRSGKPSILVTQVSDYTCELNETINEEILDEAINAIMDDEEDMLRVQGLPINAPATVDQALAEAINGNRQIPGYDKIDPHAGAGALWGACGRATKGSLLVEPPIEVGRNGAMPNRNRRLWFNPADPVSKAVYQQACAHINLGQKLKTVLSITTDKLKVEVKKREHVEKGKSRTYSDVPFDFMLAIRGLFGRYKNAITELGPEYYHGLRTNPHSPDWSAIAMRLAQFDNVYDGDYANFDRHIIEIILRKMYIRECETIRRLHPGDPWYNARMSLAKSMLFAYSAVDGSVWRGERGNKSGGVKTTIDNNKVNLINMVYLWIEITGLTYADFKKYVYLVTFGDDIVWSVDSRFKDVFCFRAIQEGMKRLGHTFTPASKDGTEPTGKIEDVTFLKRGFRSEYDGIWFAPLAKGSIWSPFSWTQLPLDDIQGWRNVAESSFRESLLHGAEYYNEARRTYQAFLRGKHHTYPHLYRALMEPSLPTYTEAKRTYMAFAGFTN